MAESSEATIPEPTKRVKAKAAKKRAKVPRKKRSAAAKPAGRVQVSA
jgi:hypothetical protein